MGKHMTLHAVAILVCAAAAGACFYKAAEAESLAFAALALANVLLCAVNVPFHRAAIKKAEGHE